MTAKKLTEAVGYVAVAGAGDPLYLAPDGTLTPDIEAAQFFSSPPAYPGFTARKVIRMLALEQTTGLL